MEHGYVRDQYDNRLAIPGPWADISQIREANIAAQSHWFSDGALRFFDSEVYPAVYGGRLFITSEKPPSGKRAYSVRAADDLGLITTVGDFCEHVSFKAARAEVARLLDRAAAINRHPSSVGAAHAGHPPTYRGPSQDDSGWNTAR